MFRLSPVLGFRPARAGRRLVPNVPKPAIRTSSAPGQGLRDRLEDSIDGVPGRRPSDSGPAGHKARNLRLVHSFSPCVAEFSRQTIAEAGAHG